MPLTFIGGMRRHHTKEGPPKRRPLSMHSWCNLCQAEEPSSPGQPTPHCQASARRGACVRLLQPARDDSYTVFISLRAGPQAARHHARQPGVVSDLRGSLFARLYGHTFSTWNSMPSRRIGVTGMNGKKRCIIAHSPFLIPLMSLSPPLHQGLLSGCPIGSRYGKRFVVTDVSQPDQA
jgi:hypothetical protein